ncbi:hypothetical protein [Luteibacter sp. SG786]|uniref:hypothetical protein n=1 Tax=Luteibacter sp. SG786 TaxID=2587130 RepID=UPI0014203160|nr:hypothetical protein [Luteibacter sp. SG786]NII54414.1 hypothetical protein [Luteibacter sp. SG786]
MALKRISDYSSAATPLAGTEMLEMETVGGTSVKCTAQDIADLSGGGGAVWGGITGTLSAQSDLQAALDAKNNLGETAGLNAQSGTTYTLVIGDKGKLIENTNASAITTTVPPNSSVAFPVNSIVYIAQGGAGQVTVAAGAGVTLKPATVKTRAQDSIIALVKTGTDTWRAMGDMA